MNQNVLAVGSVTLQYLNKKKNILHTGKKKVIIENKLENIPTRNIVIGWSTYVAYNLKQVKYFRVVCFVCFAV